MSSTIDPRLLSGNAAPLCFSVRWFSISLSRKVERPASTSHAVRAVDALKLNDDWRKKTQGIRSGDATAAVPAPAVHAQLRA